MPQDGITKGLIVAEKSCRQSCGRTLFKESGPSLPEYDQAQLQTYPDA